MDEASYEDGKHEALEYYSITFDNRKKLIDTTTCNAVR